MWYYEEAGKQCGPVEQDELIGLLSSEKISWSTLVWREGMDRWLPARQISEFQSALPVVEATTRATEGGPVVQPAVSSVYQAPQTSVVGGELVIGPKLNVCALLSMIFGIVGLMIAICCFLFAFLCSPAAIVLGHIGYSQVKKAGGRQTGGGFAIAGLVMGYLGVLLSILMLIVGIGGNLLEASANP